MSARNDPQHPFAAPAWDSVVAALHGRCCCADLPGWPACRVHLIQDEPEPVEREPVKAQPVKVKAAAPEPSPKRPRRRSMSAAEKAAGIAPPGRARIKTRAQVPAMR